MRKLLALTMIASLVFAAACGSNSGNGGSTATNTPPTSNSDNGGNNSTTSNGGNGGNSTDAEIEGLQPEEGATLLVWESKEERPFVEAIAKEFEEKYGVPIKFEEIGAGDQVNKLISDGPAGLGADVVLFPHDNLGKAVQAGLILPNDYYEEVTKEANSEIAVNAVTY